jgi:hypothetical protein
MAGLEARAENTEKEAVKPKSDQLSNSYLDLMKNNSDMHTGLPGSPADKTLPDLKITDGNADASRTLLNGDSEKRYMSWPQGHRPHVPDLEPILKGLPKDGDFSTSPDGKGPEHGLGPHRPLGDGPLPREIIDGIGSLRGGRDGLIKPLSPGFPNDHGPAPVPVDKSDSRPGLETRPSFTASPSDLPEKASGTARDSKVPEPIIIPLHKHPR